METENENSKLPPETKTEGLKGKVTYRGRGFGVDGHAKLNELGCFGKIKFDAPYREE